MSRVDDFLQGLQKFKEKQNNPPKEWEILRDRIMSSEESDEYWWGLRSDVDTFFHSDAPKEDKEKLSGYLERLLIMLDWTEKGIDDLIK